MQAPAVIRALVVFVVTVIFAPAVVGAQERFFSTRFGPRELELEQLETLLARFGVEIPFEVSGRVAVEGEIGYPRGALLAPRRYRVSLELSSPQLTIEGIELEDVRAELLYQDGVLRLQQFAFEIPYGPFPPGVVTGSAVLPIAPEGDLRAELNIAGLPIPRVLEVLPGLEDFARGRLSAEVQARVDPDRVREVEAWRITGSFELNDAVPPGLPPIDAAGQFRVDDGTLYVTDVAGSIASARFRAEGRLGLTPPYPYSLGVGLADSQIAWLNELPEDFRPPLPVQGAVRLTGRATGNLEPFTWQVTASGTGQQIQAGELLVDTLAAEVTARELPEAEAPADEASPWQASGNVRATGVRAEGLLVESIATPFTLDRNELILPEMTANLYGGLARGEAAVPLTGMGDVEADLRLQGVAVGLLLDSLDAVDFPFRGEAEGAVELAIPVDAVEDISRWRGVGRLTLADVQFLRWTAGVARAEFQIHQGTLLLSELVATQDETRLRLSGSVGLQTPYEYVISAEADRFDLGNFNALPGEMQPPVEIEGVANLQIEGQGQLEPFSFVGRGAGGAAPLRIDGVLADRVNFAFRADEHLVEILELEAALYGGLAGGSGVWPLDEEAPARADVQWRDVNVARLLDDALDLPVDLEGVSRGEVALAAPPGAADDFRQWTIEAEIAGEEIHVNGVPTAAFLARAQREEDLLVYDVNATVLDGRLRVEGRLPLSPEADDEAAGGALTLTDLQFDRLDEIFRRTEAIRGIRGVLDAQVTFEHEVETFAPRGDGFFSLRSVEIAGLSIVDRLEGQLVFTPEFLRVANLVGGLAGGRIQAEATYRLAAGQGGEFQLVLRGAEADRLAGVLLEDDLPIAGRFDLHLRGRLGEAIYASGRAVVSRAEAVGFGLGTVHAPLTLEFHPERGRGRLTLSDLGATLARGRLSGDVELSWGYGVDLEADVQFNQVDLRSLLEEYGVGAGYVAGRLTGSLELAARDMRSLNDLSGSFEARLRDVQALKFPVLSALQPYVGGASFNTTFNEGDVRATLSRGVVRVHYLTLLSEAARIYLDGTVTLSGRLNLEAVIQTGQLEGAGLAFQRLVERYLAVAAPPAALLAEASAFLSNRVIYLRIGGTISRPVPRVQPLPLLRDEVIRFLLAEIQPFNGDLRDDSRDRRMNRR